jgi:hypothetical protein
MAIKTDGNYTTLRLVRKHYGNLSISTQSKYDWIEVYHIHHLSYVPPSLGAAPLQSDVSGLGYQLVEIGVSPYGGGLIEVTFVYCQTPSNETWEVSDFKFIYPKAGLELRGRGIIDPASYWSPSQQRAGSNKPTKMFRKKTYGTSLSTLTLDSPPSFGGGDSDFEGPKYEWDPTYDNYPGGVPIGVPARYRYGRWISVGTASAASYNAKSSTVSPWRGKIEVRDDLIY